MPPALSLLIVELSSQPGHIYKRISVLKYGSVNLRLHGKKELLKTPILERVTGYHVTRTQRHTQEMLGL